MYYRRFFRLRPLSWQNGQNDIILNCKYISEQSPGFYVFRQKNSEIFFLGKTVQPSKSDISRMITGKVCKIE